MELLRKIIEYEGPSYERQNQFLHDFITPILIRLDFGKVFRNIKRVKQGFPTESMEQIYQKDMENAGVYESISQLPDRENIESILSSVRNQINFAARFSPVSQDIVRRNLVLLDGEN